ncbi:MAG: SRPBCC family protein [Acidobacteriota bacterium]
MIEPLRRSFVVRCGVTHAFDVFAAKTSLWWPHTHSVSQAPGITVMIEPMVGGRILERTPAGEEFEWGTVVAWDPPTRLSYSWHLRADRADATDVAITFTAIDLETTRVDILHSGWERLGDRGQARRDGNQKGWSGLLPHYVAACSSHTDAARRAR